MTLYILTFYFELQWNGSAIGSVQQEVEGGAAAT